MAKQMKSFRLDDYTSKGIADVCASLEVSQADFIQIMFAYCQESGFIHELSVEKGNRGYVGLWSAYDIARDR